MIFVHRIFFLDIDLNAYYSGIELGEMLREKNAKCKIVYLTSHPNKAIAVINRNITPSGYLIKEFTYEKIKNIQSYLLKEKENEPVQQANKKSGRLFVMAIAIIISITMRFFI